MQLGFSTMGDPALTYADASRLASEFNLQYIDLRVLEGSLDLPGYFRTQSNIELETGVPVRIVCTSFHLEDTSAASLEECLAFAEVAARLRAPFIRVFAGGGGTRPDSSEVQLAPATVRHVRSELLRRELDVELLLETHGGYSFSAPCLELERQLDQPLGLLWDSHHTWKIGGESLGQTWENLAPFIRHLHYKDSISVPGSSGQFRYVIPGTGEFPTSALFDLLKQENFQGGVSLEWEKLWHPELAPLREALKAFRHLG
jgi:sugar phosphate isomerase/epimerase